MKANKKKEKPVTGSAEDKIASEESPHLSDPREEAISSAFPFESKYVQVLGSKMHYVERGEGEPIIFIHGNPTSSYLWRNVIPHISPAGRAIALDLIGFGKSDKPGIGYTYQEHYAYVEGFIDALNLENITFVIHDWGSVLGFDYISRHEENVLGVAFMEAIIPPAFPMQNYEAMGPVGKLFKSFRTPGEGQRLIMEENVFINYILGNTTITRRMSTEEMAVYNDPFLSRFPIYCFPNELPIGGEPARNVEVVTSIGEWLRVSEKPKLLLYARPGAITSPESIQWMLGNYRNLEAIFIGYGSHYIQEDNPEAIGRNIAHWYERKIRG